MRKITLVEPKAGQSAVYYINGKIILRDSYVTNARVYTPWEFFIGTEAEVEAKVSELGLTF